MLLRRRFYSGTNRMLHYLMQRMDEGQIDDMLRETLIWDELLRKRAK